MKHKEGLKNSNKHLETLYQEIAAHIHQARVNVLKSVNHEMVKVYWHIGKRIVEIVQGGGMRAQYGESLLEKLSSRATDNFGRCFSDTSLKYFRQLYLTFPDGIDRNTQNMVK